MVDLQDLFGGMHLQSAWIMDFQVSLCNIISFAWLKIPSMRCAKPVKAKGQALVVPPNSFDLIVIEPACLASSRKA